MNHIVIKEMRGSELTNALGIQRNTLIHHVLDVVDTDKKGLGYNDRESITEQIEFFRRKLSDDNFWKHLNFVYEPWLCEVVRRLALSRPTWITLESSFSQSSKLSHLVGSLNQSTVARSPLNEIEGYVWDECIDLSTGQAIPCYNIIAKQGDFFEGKSCFAYIVSIGDIDLAIPSLSFIADPLWAKLFCHEGKALEEIQESLEDSTVFRLFGHLDSGTWDRMLMIAKLAIKRKGLNYSPSKIATQWAEEMMIEDGDLPVVKLFLSSLVGPEKESIQDAGLKVWDATKREANGNQKLLPTGKQMMQAILARIDLSEAKAFARRHRSASSKSKSAKSKRRSWRAPHSQVDPMDVTDYQLRQMSQAFRGAMNNVVRTYGLSYRSLPAISWSKTATAISLELWNDQFTVPVSYLNRDWNTIEELAKWVITVGLAEDYLDSNSNLTREDAFKLAAQRLALSPVFARQGPVLRSIPPNWSLGEDGLNSDQKAVMRKVDKLLALAGSSNQAESELAMQRAQEMLRSYNLEGDDKNFRQSDLVRLTLYLGTVNINRLVRTISNILSSFYFVEIVFSHAWNIEADRYESTVILLGEHHNVLMAEYVFDFLMYKVDSLWQSAKAGGMESKQKLSYQLGVLHGFRGSLARIEAERRNRNSEQSRIEGLIALKSQKLDEYVARLFPDLKSTSAGHINLDRDVYNTGSNQGSSLRIDRPLANSDQGGGDTLLLE